MQTTAWSSGFAVGRSSLYCSLQLAHRHCLSRAQNRVLGFRVFDGPHSNSQLNVGNGLVGELRPLAKQLIEPFSKSSCANRSALHHVKSITSFNFSSLLKAVLSLSVSANFIPCVPSRSFISPIFPVTRASRTRILSSSFPSSPSRVTRLGWIFSCAFVKGSRRV